ncbi:hypothetical protein [uncultured Nostoc sp.]|uniref:hypothetical protein n=1 Tax=uncultured Nostoc sp. TaxID=340711 RepID=UPI0035CB0AB7
MNLIWLQRFSFFLVHDAIAHRPEGQYIQKTPPQKGSRKFTGMLRIIWYLH